MTTFVEDYTPRSKPAEEWDALNNGNSIDKPAVGIKHDTDKVCAGVILDFSLALNEVAKVGTFGIGKYERGNWVNVPNGIERYTDAKIRHMLQNNIDAESGLLHAAHEAWNALAVLELKLRGK